MHADLNSLAAAWHQGFRVVEVTSDNLKSFFYLVGKLGVSGKIQHHIPVCKLSNHGIRLLSYRRNLLNEPGTAEQPSAWAHPRKSVNPSG